MSVYVIRQTGISKNSVLCWFYVFYISKPKNSIGFLNSSPPTLIWHFFFVPLLIWNFKFARISHQEERWYLQPIWQGWKKRNRIFALIKLDTKRNNWPLSCCQLLILTTTTVITTMLVVTTTTTIAPNIATPATPNTQIVILCSKHHRSASWLRWLRLQGFCLHPLVCIFSLFSF